MNAGLPAAWRRTFTRNLCAVRAGAWGPPLMNGAPHDDLPHREGDEVKERTGAGRALAGILAHTGCDARTGGPQRAVS